MVRTFYLIFVIAAVALTGCNAQKDGSASTSETSPALTLESDEEKLSYGVGMNIGFSLTRQGVPDLQLDAVIAGIRDSVNGIDPKVSETDVQQAATRIQERQEAELAVLAEENGAKGVEFLKENAAREGIVTTESGLQYEVLKEGEGESPSAESVIRAHYHGTLIDGTVFDSSIDRGEPTQFAVNQVIPGWTEALQLMKVGGKMRIFVPADLAYGERSPGPAIPPNSTLIFDVELVEILKNDQAEDA